MFSLWDILFGGLPKDTAEPEVTEIEPGCGRDNQPRQSQHIPRQTAPSDYVPPTSVK